MNITELRYLVAIKKWGSVSAAAKQLYAAQPNVSKALKNLEGEYGLRIFERSSTGMIPTEQGRRFIEQAARVLALDHWMARGVALNAPGPQWRAEGEASRLPPPHLSAQDIVWIEGYLLEPSGFNAAGEPVALNFATGELDTRQLRHPDGVILDIGTHVLAMLRETLLGCRGDVTLDLAVRVVKDRLGRDIAHGDMVTAEGEAHLQGRLGDIPLNIWLNKYAGPAGGQKGMRIGLRDGRVITLDRAPEGEVVTLQDGERVQRWTRPGAIYTHCLDEQILGADNLFIRAPDSVAGLTQRRLEEVEWLLRLQQQLRGPH